MRKSCILAFSLYSRIPVPQAEWKEENLRWVFCFFPLVGAVTGALEAVLSLAARALGLGQLCTAAFRTALPVLVTGGIHLDGFMDTADALSAHTDPVRRQEILRDSHVGAFAVTGCGVYLVLMLGIWSEVEARFLAAASGCFVLSRCLTGLLAVTLPAAREEGMLRTLTEAAPKRTVRRVLILETVVAAALLLLFGGAAGAGMCAAALLTFGGCRRLFLREFGGISGDPAGFFLQLCELLQLLALSLLQGRFG